jgi:hypothetical protein
MRQLATTIGCAIVSVALVPLGTPTAHADDASFVRDAKALGFAFDTDNLISMGRSACYFLYEGERLRADPLRDNPPDRVADRIARYGSVGPDQAHQFLILSVKEYCPQYSDRVGA